MVCEFPRKWVRMLVIYLEDYHEQEDRQLKVYLESCLDKQKSSKLLLELDVEMGAYFVNAFLLMRRLLEIDVLKVKEVVEVHGSQTIGEINGRFYAS